MDATVINSEERNDSGQTMAEYAVVLGTITVAIVLVISQLAGAIEVVLVKVLDVIKVGA